jgi:dUTP pyrophosphatase
MQTKPSVEVKVLNPVLEGRIPKYATPGSAGMDILAVISSQIILRPGDSTRLPTGFAMHINNPSVAAILLPRSGLGAKHGVVLGNLVGLIDSDYTGEVEVSVWNRNLDKEIAINPFDRIAQMVFVPILQVDWDIVPELSTTERGAGGFGSTGIGDTL